MKPTTANLLNALVLIAAGLYGYYGIAVVDGTPSKTALIPAAFGLLFILLNMLWAKNAKLISHVIVVLTLILLIMCTMRFVKVEGWNAKKYLFLACMISNALALIVFIKSFMKARISKN